MGLCVPALLVTSSASATVMVEVPLEELVLGAEAIVHATVVESDERVVMDDGELEPCTFTTLEVREWLGGQPRSGASSTVVLRELGGTFQGITRRAEGTPRYAVGDEVIVFLARRPDGARDYRTMAMAQGKFIVRRGVGGMETTVERDLEGISFATPGEANAIRHPQTDARMELSAFLAYVRQTRGETLAAEPPSPPTGGAR
ncbi:MAG: hypothetical protein AB7P00_43120 [Sandaracinaceae bacterium]